MSTESNNTNLTAAQVRKIERLTPAIDRISDADRAFFAAHPDRNFRIRPMSKVEKRSHVILNGSFNCPPGSRHYTLVKQIAPGVRLRMGATIRELHRVEHFSDAACRLIFEGLLMEAES